MRTRFENCKDEINKWNRDAEGIKRWQWAISSPTGSPEKWLQQHNYHPSFCPTIPKIRQVFMLPSPTTARGGQLSVEQVIAGAILFPRTGPKVFSELLMHHIPPPLQHIHPKTCCFRIAHQTTMHSETLSKLRFPFVSTLLSQLHSYFHKINISNA